MQLLLKDKYIVNVASKIEAGIYDEPFEKYALYDEEGNLIYYAIKDHYEVSGEVTLPSDYAEDKYFYENGEFVLNEDWRPYVSPEERIAILEETVVLQDEQLIASDEAVVLLYEMQMTQDEINGAQDEAITGLYELMLGGE